MTDPLRVNEVDEELRQQFNQLMVEIEDIVTFDPNREEGAYDALNERIYQAVTEKPILARIVNGSNQSLLAVASTNLNLGARQLKVLYYRPHPPSFQSANMDPG